MKKLDLEGYVITGIKDGEKIILGVVDNTNTAYKVVEKYSNYNNIKNVRVEITNKYTDGREDLIVKVESILEKIEKKIIDESYKVENKKLYFLGCNEQETFVWEEQKIKNYNIEALERTLEMLQN